MPGRLTLTALRGALLLPLLVPSFAGSARADVYHAVAAGETLAAVAAKYRISTEQLRTANGLADADSAPLGAMLLRVPTSDNKNSAATPNLEAAPVTNTFGGNTFGGSAVTSGRSVTSGRAGSGVIARTVSETVRPGDTWDTIATRYRAAGHDVSIQSLRDRNNWIDLPAAGSTVVVPLGQTAYTAPAPSRFAQRTSASTTRPMVAAPVVTAQAQTVPSAAAMRNTSTAPRNLGGGVVASGEMGMPVAQDLSTNQPPVFTSGAPVLQVRGNNLPSRGGYGQMARTATGGEVRVLSPGEDATAPPVVNRARVATQTTSTNTSVAKVAKVASTGARIRRLPESSAVTLYNCSVGTQLAVLKQSGMWSAVLMSDRSTGWLPTKYLSMTKQTVDVTTQVAQVDPGGKVNSFSRAYQGENPMVAQALKWLGTPYRYGGTTRRGIDCSALVQNSFRACGYKLPRTAATQAKVGAAVAPAELRAGDRLYFSASGTRIDHTGLYMGNGLFVHASGSGRQVMVSNLFTPRNWNIFVGARR